MFGIEFYPTPANIIERMLAPYARKGGLTGRTILEPSAGKADIADYINPPKESERWSSYRAKANLDCVEIDGDLVAVLQAHGHRVVGHDFLSFTSAKMYDLIVMNPPFSNGDKHLLHAWEILHGGDIVCLLNAETLSNPHTKTRQLLSRIIAAHGTVEELGPCFDTAERKTSVNVVMVRLQKQFQDKYGQLFEQAKQSKTSPVGEFSSPEEIFLPANKDVIGNFVLQFDEAVETYKKILVMGSRLNTAIHGARGKSVSGYYRDEQDAHIKEGIFSSDYKEAFNTFLEQLTEDSWQNVINISKLDQLMTAGVRRSFQKQTSLGTSLPFTRENIFALLDGLRENVLTIMRNALCEVFDYLTMYHEENRVHVEGWKTNDRFKVSRKFILPYVVDYDPLFSRKSRFKMNSSRYQEMRDIDRVMCSLTGLKFDNIVTIQKALDASFGTDGEGTAESEFFTIRYYKKGTGHFTFKDESLRERFCIEYAKDKKWLPSNYTYEEHGPITGEIALEENTGTHGALALQAA